MEEYNKIINDLNSLREFIDEKPSKKLLDMYKEKLTYSDEFINAFIENQQMFLQILSRYKTITNIWIEKSSTLDSLINFTNSQIITLNNSESKKIFKIYDKLILQYLIQINFFQKCYDELDLDNKEVTKNQVIQYKKENPNTIITDEKFNWRSNQKEAIDRLNKNGLETGIHLQATGTGKTFIILKYIDYVHKLNPKCKIILFTERVSILADLFDFENTTNAIDASNVKFWKEKGICDLTNFNIIDRVTVKTDDWDELLNKSTKPTLLVINRAYLTLRKKYESINLLSLVLHDECHNVASNKCFEFLKFCASKLIKIVGFSATPLRSGKTKSGDISVSNKSRLLEIYGLAEQLNLLTNYNMIYAISSNLILAPRFHWYEFDLDDKDDKNIDSDKKDNKKKNELLSKAEIGSVMEVLNDIMLLMPNKKIIAWCGTIPRCDEWYNKFEEQKDYWKGLKNLQVFKDHSVSTVEKGYDDFKILESHGIMFCAQKHREGSDISKLDGCIFLDRVKNRGSIPFIQSIGRVLRKENITSSKKTCGFIIDGIAKDNEEYEKNIVDKILGYYFALNDISGLDDEPESSYEKYIKLMDLINFDIERKLIKLKLNSANIEINCKRLDWKNIINKFDDIIGQKVKLNVNDKLKVEFDKLKKRIKNKGFKTMGEYYEYAVPRELELEPDVTYQKFWINYCDFLNIDTTNYPTSKEKLKKIFVKHNIENQDDYKKLTETYDLPYDPCEYYKVKKFTYFMAEEDELLL